MITYGQARLIAEQHLAASSADLVIIGDQDFDEGWVFFCDLVRHQETGSVRDAVAGNAPILVDRETWVPQLGVLLVTEK